VVMPGIGPGEAVVVAERLRAGVEAILLARAPRVTVSIGVASASQGHCSGDALLRAGRRSVVRSQAGRP